MPPTFEQDMQAMLAEADPARRRFLAARMIDAGTHVGMTRGQADEIVGLLAQRDTIPFEQAKAEIGQAWQGLQTQTPVQAPSRALDRSTRQGAVVQQAQLDAAMRGGGVQLPEPYYAGPPEGREAYMRRFYESQGANEAGVIPRQDGNFAASLLGTDGGQAWYTDPAGTAVAVAGGLGVEPGASMGYNLSRVMEGQPEWQTPEEASATAMRNQLAAGPVQFIRRKQAENMAGSIAGTLGGYAGAAGVGGRAGLRATQAIGRGGARTAARAGAAVAGENVAIGAQAGLLEAGRTVDADAALRAGAQATTPGIVATVATKLARGQAVAPMEWADLGLSLGFDGVSVFQAMRAVGLPDNVARSAAGEAVRSREMLALPPGRRAISVDPQGNVVGEQGLGPTVYEPARTRATMVGDTGQARPGAAERTQTPGTRSQPELQGPYRVEPEAEPLFAQRAETPSLTRQNIDDVLIAKAEETGVLRSADDIEAQLREELGSEFSTRFSGGMPTELKEALEGRPHLRTLIRTNQTDGIGEDVLSRLGTDRFVSYLEQMGESRGRAAAEGLEGFTDPDIDWLVHARGAAQPNERMSMVQADALKPGATFRLGGDAYTVAERGGDLVAIDADGGVRGIMGQVPITRSSLGDAEPQAALDALKRADEFEQSDPGFDDAMFHAPDLDTRLVRTEPSPMQEAGFDRVATMDTQSAAEAWIRRQEGQGGPQHMVVPDGDRYAVLRGPVAPTLLVAMGLGTVAKGIADAQSPEEAEASIQTAGIGGDLDLSNPYVWALLGAAAYVGAGVTAKAVGKSVPGASATKDAAKRVARAPREAASFYAGPLVDRLAKAGKGKEATTQFVDAARSATDEANAAMRTWSAEIIDPVARRMHGAGSVVAGRRARAELQHLERVAEVDGVEAFESRGQRLVEGLEDESSFSKPVRQWLQAYRRMFKATGKHMEDAGLEIEIIGEDGNPAVVPFVQQGDPKWVRNVSPDLVRALVEGGDYGQEVVNAVAKAVTALNKSEDAAGEWKRVANAIKSSYDGSDVSTAKVIRTVNAEHLRMIERMPAAINFRFGNETRTIHLLDVDPIRQLEQMSSKAALRSSVAKHVGYERSTHYGREKSISDMRQAVAQETGGTGGDLFDETLRSLSGLPLAQHLRYTATPGSSAYDVARVVRSTFNMLRQWQLSASFVVNMPEPAALPRVMTGNRNFAKALVELGTRPRSTVRELRREGGITRDNTPWYGLSRPMTPHDPLGNFITVFESVSRTLGRSISSAHRLSNEWGELVSAASARAFIDDLRAAKAGAYHRARLRMMNFNDAQVEQLASGKASDDLYQAVQTRAAQRMVGSNSMPHELSKAGNSNAYRAVVWHDSYTQMITNRTGKMLSMIFDPDLPKAERRAAAVMAADLGISGGMVGLTGIMLRAVVYGGLGGLAYEWNRSRREMSGEEGVEGASRFLGRVFEAYFGGPMYAAMGSAFDDGLTATDVVRASGAAVAGMELWNFLTGSGRYAHLPLHEQTDLYLRSTTPIYRGTTDWIAAHALGDDHAEYNAAKRAVYAYMRDNGLIAQGEFGQAEAFTVGMRRARRQIMAGDYEKARQTMIEAAQSEGRSWDQVRQSLLGMRILPRIPLKDRATHLQAIRGRLGEDGYARVLMHDRLLEAMAR